MMFQLYIIFILSYVKWILFGFSVAIGSITFIVFLVNLYDNELEENSKIINKILIICFILIIITTFIPTTKDMLISYTIVKVKDSKVFQETNDVSQLGLKLLKIKLQNYIKLEKGEEQ